MVSQNPQPSMARELRDLLEPGSVGAYGTLFIIYASLRDLAWSILGGITGQSKSPPT